MLCQDYTKIKLVNLRSVSPTTCTHSPGKSEISTNKMTPRNHAFVVSFLGAVILKKTVSHSTI